MLGTVTVSHIGRRNAYKSSSEHYPGRVGRILYDLDRFPGKCREESLPTGWSRYHCLNSMIRLSNLLMPMIPNDHAWTNTHQVFRNRLH
jgi:hypothetical protein